MASICTRTCTRYRVIKLIFILSIEGTVAENNLNETVTIPVNNKDISWTAGKFVR